MTASSAAKAVIRARLVDGTRRRSLSRIGYPFTFGGWHPVGGTVVGE
jgi:hypothetical protein